MSELDKIIIRLDAHREFNASLVKRLEILEKRIVFLEKNTNHVWKCR